MVLEGQETTETLRRLAPTKTDKGLRPPKKSGNQTIIIQHTVRKVKGVK